MWWKMIPSIIGNLICSWAYASAAGIWKLPYTTNNQTLNQTSRQILSAKALPRNLPPPPFDHLNNTVIPFFWWHKYIDLLLVSNAHAVSRWFALLERSVWRRPWQRPSGMCVLFQSSLIGDDITVGSFSGYITVTLFQVLFLLKRPLLAVPQATHLSQITSQLIVRERLSAGTGE